jgi:hypothetical protein
MAQTETQDSTIATDRRLGRIRVSDQLLRASMNTLCTPILPASPRPIDRCVDTGRVVIGLAHQRPPMAPESRDALTLQRALLDPRTAHQPGLLGLIFGRIYQWL